MSLEGREFTAEEIRALGTEGASVEFPETKHLHYGSFRGNPIAFDMRSASIGRLPFGVNDVELACMEKISDRFGHQCTPLKDDSQLREVASKIVRSETNVDLSNYHLYVSSGGAREALARVIGSVISVDRPLIAYATPNWAFDSFPNVVEGSRGLPFYAPTRERFVSEFEALPNKDKIAALIIVDPHNPLNYRLSAEDVSRLDSLCESNGIVPIFDDVFRGMQEKGERLSSSSHSKLGVIVETTSKRFGTRGLGATWTLVPHDSRVTSLDLTIPCQPCSELVAEVVNSLYSSGYGERVIEHVSQRTNAFVAGLANGFQGEPFGKVVLPFRGIPLFPYFLPSRQWDSQSKANLHQVASTFTGATSGLDWISDRSSRKIPLEEIAHGLEYLRICPTKEPPERMYLAARSLGSMIRHHIPL